jgi:hypothetical protein
MAALLALGWTIAPVATAAAGRPGLCAAAATGTSAPYLAVVSAYPAELAPIAAATEVDATLQIGSRSYYLFDPVVRFGGRAVSFDPFGTTPAQCTPGGGDVFGCELPPAALVTTGDARLLHPRSITTTDVEDMESAAVARVAATRRVPFLAVRAGSDGGGDPRGDRGFPAQFFDYYRLAAHNAGDVTRAIVAALGRLAGDPSERATCRLLARRQWRRAAARIDHAASH